MLNVNSLLENPLVSIGRKHIVFKI